MYQHDDHLENGSENSVISGSAFMFASVCECVCVSVCKCVCVGRPCGRGIQTASWELHEHFRVIFLDIVRRRPIVNGLIIVFSPTQMLYNSTNVCVFPRAFRQTHKMHVFQVYRLIGPWLIAYNSCIGRIIDRRRYWNCENSLDFGGLGYVRLEALGTNGTQTVAFTSFPEINWRKFGIEIHWMKSGQVWCMQGWLNARDTPHERKIDQNQSNHFPPSSFTVVSSESISITTSFDFQLCYLKTKWMKEKGENWMSSGKLQW